MNTALATLTSKLASNLDMGDDGHELIETLKQTAFKGANVTDAQMTALMVVANQYGLNPWTKEIYAYPSQNGIVPVVGIDGWSRIINDHPAFDGIEFDQADDSFCTCKIYRKDRSRPIVVTEYLNECKGDSKPWKSHPRRMLRHKAMIQCARIAFGYGGIYDPDEADRIIEKDITNEAERIERPASRVDLVKAALVRTNDRQAPTVEDVRKAIESAKSLADLKAVSDLAKSLPEDHRATLRDLFEARKSELNLARMLFAQIADQINTATSRQDVDDAMQLAAVLPDDQRADLADLAMARAAELEKAA